MSTPSATSTTSTPSTEAVRWRMTSTESLAKSLQDEGHSPEEALAKAQMWDASGPRVDEKVTDQVAADVAALVARARALACRE